MLRIFRKLRKRLLQQNKFTQYVIYALGEIVLIVIGILIALALNNWNQNKELDKKEQLYLSGLQTEFERSKTKLETLIEVNKVNYNKAEQIASFINDKTAINEQTLAELLLQSLSYEIAYNPNNSLLNELISSGSLKDISNTQLRMHLTNWESQIQSISRQEATLRNEREHLVDIFRDNSGSIKTILDLSNASKTEMNDQDSKAYFSNMDLVKSRAFENNLLLFILTGKETEASHYKPLMEEIDTILQLIEKEKE